MAQGEDKNLETQSSYFTRGIVYNFIFIIRMS